MQRPSIAIRHIQRLAIEDRPGALVLAEHAVDLHAELFSDPGDKRVALDALARDLVCLRHRHPQIAAFLKLVDDYIRIAQEAFDRSDLPPDSFSPLDLPVEAGAPSDESASPERRPTPSIGVQMKTTPAASSA